MIPLDQARLADALAFALEAHGDQSRKGRPAPYVSHLLQVSGLVLEYGGGVTEAVAALLHDVVEDCPEVDASALRTRFGDDVARIVLGCTDTLPGDTPEKKSPWIDRKRSFLARLEHAAPDVHLVSVCDKLHNLSALIADLQHEGEETLERFSASPRQTRWYYESARAALAHAPAELLGRFDAQLALLREYVAEASPER